MPSIWSRSGRELRVRLSIRSSMASVSVVEGGVGEHLGPVDVERERRPRRPGVGEGDAVLDLDRARGRDLRRGAVAQGVGVLRAWSMGWGLRTRSSSSHMPSRIEHAVALDLRSTTPELVVDQHDVGSWSRWRVRMPTCGRIEPAVDQLVANASTTRRSASLASVAAGSPRGRACPPLGSPLRPAAVSPPSHPDLPSTQGTVADLPPGAGARHRGRPATAPRAPPWRPGPDRVAGRGRTVAPSPAASSTSATSSPTGRSPTRACPDR